MTIAAEFAPYSVSLDTQAVPDAELVVAPDSIAQAEQILDLASEHRMTTVILGGGTHQGIGGRVVPDLVLSTARLQRLVDWQPEDLTATVEGGMRVADLEALLHERGQTAVLPELPGDGTVGGALAAAASGWRRSRYGPTRDRVLEVDLITGDGRHVRAGARVVKNVTGFDLPRLTVGSLGKLGLIAQACLKLWPVPEACATVAVADATEALERSYRPAAIVETNGAAKVFLGGTEAEVDRQTHQLAGDAQSGWKWDPEPFGTIRWSLRVPPKITRQAIDMRPEGWLYQAGIGVGEVRLASETADGALELRGWAESRGGALVLVGGPDELYHTIDPWGTPPASLAIQRRLIRLFDPVGVMNPGRLPGGI